MFGKKLLYFKAFIVLYKPILISLVVLFVGIMLMVISVCSYIEFASFRIGIAINFLIGLIFSLGAFMGT